MKNADLVLYLYDIAQTSAEELELRIQDFNEQGIKFLLVGNKLDVCNALLQEYPKDLPNSILISAKKNLNLDALKDKIVELSVDGNIDTESTVVTNVRHYEALKQLSISLDDVLKGVGNNIPGDLLSIDIRQCLHHLGLITGEITNEEQLDLIFSKFCIGK